MKSISMKFIVPDYIEQEDLASALDHTLKQWSFCFEANQRHEVLPVTNEASGTYAILNTSSPDKNFDNKR